MDSFINLAKKGYEAYDASQQGQQGGQGHGQGGQGGHSQSRQGGQGGYDQGGQGGYGGGQGGYDQGNQGQGGYNQGSQGQGGYGDNQGEGQYGLNQPGGGGGRGSHPGPDLDHDAVIQNASQHAGSSGDSSMFGSAMGFINQNQSQHTQPIDEQNVQNAHSEAYQKGNASSLDANSLGSAAAMQVLKQFTSGGGSSGGSGNSQTQLISLAMAEASKLFDSQGSSGGQKQDAVNGAAMTIVKLLVQSKMGVPTTGGGNSGGLGGLMSLASQFMK